MNKMNNIYTDLCEDCYLEGAAHETMCDAWGEDE